MNNTKIMNVVWQKDCLTLMIIDTVTGTGEHFNVDSSHHLFADIRKAAFEKDIELVRTLIKTPKTLSLWSNGVFSIVETGGVASVTKNGQPIDPRMEERVLRMFREGYPVQPLLSFYDRLAANPSHRVATQLYDFLQNVNIPLTDSGHFVCYKTVRQDYMDIHSGTFRNCIGDAPFMNRQEVDDDPNRTCSRGLHVGALPYVTMFGGSNGRVMIVQVDPADVVSVPVDYHAQKMRVCKYSVVAEYTGPLDSNTYGTVVTVNDPDDDDDYFPDDDDTEESDECPCCGEPIDSEYWEFCPSCGTEL